MKLNRIFMAVLVLGLTAAATAQQRHARRTPIVEAFESNRGAVVSISSTEVRVVQDDFFSRGFAFPFRAHRWKRVPALGSGFIVHESGYIVTNAHVVATAIEVKIMMARDDKQYDARLVHMDKAGDVALLKIEPDGPLPAVRLGRSDDLMIGETVLAIGNPFGYQQTLTDGVISAVHRDLELDEQLELRDLIQISAPINPGSSGGPLLNINGDVIGMNTAIRRAAEGIGFSIPVDNLRERLGALLNVDRLRRIDLGLEVTQVPKDPASESPAGKVVVQSVWPGGAADKAGLKAGDVLHKIDDQTIQSDLDFLLYMLEAPLGAKVRFTVRRQANERYRCTIVLRERPIPDGATLAQKWFGMKLGELTAGTIRKYDLQTGKPGDVVVLSVERNSPAAFAGIEPRDVLTAMNGSQVQTLADVGLLLELMGPDVPVRMTVQRTEAGHWGRYVAVPYHGTLRTRDDED